MATISSVTFTGTQRNPTITITGSGFGSAPATAATPAGSGKSGYDYGRSLYVSDLTGNFSAGIYDSVTNNSIGLTNLSYTDTSITFQLGSAYSQFLYNFKPGDSIGVGVAGAIDNTTVAFTPALSRLTIGIARFFDTQYGTHFYTASAGEVQQVLATRPDLTEETNGFAALDPASSGANTAPVYRFFDSVYGTHFFTASSTERDSVLATRPDLKPEGTAFNEDTTLQSGDTAVYRYFDLNNGTHFFTADAAEISAIANTRPDLKSEGIAFYAPTNA